MKSVLVLLVFALAAHAATTTTPTPVTSPSPVSNTTNTTSNCTVTCSGTTYGGSCAFANGTTFTSTTIVTNGTTVSCASGTTETSTTSGTGTCSSGNTIALSCVNAALAPASAYTDKTSLEAALISQGLAFGDPGNNCNAQGSAIGSAATSTFCTASGILYSCSNLFSCTARQVAGQVVTVCNYTATAAQTACLQNAACTGALNNVSTCYIGGVNTTCPTCSSGSKKGLLGLLGLLGLIPLLLCSLLCCLLLLCCIRRKKTAGAVHFATIDAAQPPLFTGMSMAPVATAIAAPIYGDACLPHTDVCLPPQPFHHHGASVYA